MFCGNFLLFTVHFSCTALLIKALIAIFPYFSVCYNASSLEWIMCLFIAAYTFRFSKRKFLNDEITPEKKAVLITGCDSGFGHLLAKRLDSKGFVVFACCLFPNGNGASELQKTCSNRLRIIGLDVTKDESVKQAKEFVLKNLSEFELWAIVNNAGILKGLTVELTSLKDFQDCLEVNTFGVVRVTKAFLPLLRKSKGRIVNVTSVAGRLTLPFMAPYFMSKYAAVAFNDVLRKEMDDWGIRVISVEPDFFATQMTNETLVEKEIDLAVSVIEDDLRSDYGEDYLGSFKSMKRHLFQFTGSNTKKVIDALDSAITLTHPDIIYEPRSNILTTIILQLYYAAPYKLQDTFFKKVKWIVGFPKPRTATGL